MHIVLLMILHCVFTLYGALPASLERFNLAHMHERDLSRPSLRVLEDLLKDFCNTQDAKELIKKNCQKYLTLLTHEGFLEASDACVRHAASALPKQSEDALGFCAYGLLLSRLAALYQGTDPELFIPGEVEKKWWSYALTRVPELEKKEIWPDVLRHIMQYTHLPNACVSWVFDLRALHDVDIPIQLHGMHYMHHGGCFQVVAPEYGGCEMHEIITLSLYGLSLCPPLICFENLPISADACYKERDAFILVLMFSADTHNHAEAAFTDIVLRELRNIWDTTLETHDSCQKLTTGFVMLALFVALKHPTEHLQTLTQVVPSRAFFMKRQNLAALHEHIDVGYVVQRIKQENVAKGPESCVKREEEYRQCAHWCRQKYYELIVNHYIEKLPDMQRCFEAIDRHILSTPRLTGVVEQFKTVFINIMGICLDCVTEQCLQEAKEFCERCAQNRVNVVVLSKTFETSQQIKTTLTSLWKKPWSDMVSDVVTMADLLPRWKNMMGLDATTTVFFVGMVPSYGKANLTQSLTEVADIKQADIVMVAKTTEPLSKKEQAYIEYMLLSDTPALSLTPQVRVVHEGRPQTVPDPFIAALCARGGRTFSFMNVEETLLLYGLQRQGVGAEKAVVVTDEVVRLQAAKKLDIASALLESGSYKRGDALPVRPDYFSEGFFPCAVALSAHL